MNKQQLEENLIALRVNPRNYTLAGFYKDSSWVLESVYNRKKAIEAWVVFKFERGKRYEEQRFTTEDEACDYFYERLKLFQDLIGKYNL